MSDETIVLHKYLHFLWSDLSMALWTIILCVDREERGGGQGRKGGSREEGGGSIETCNAQCILHLFEPVVGHVTVTTVT